MMVNLIMRVLAYQLEERGIRDPLRQFYKFADIWAELARLQQEPLPPDIAAIVKEPPFTGLALPEVGDG